MEHYAYVLNAVNSTALAKWKLEAAMKTTRDQFLTSKRTAEANFESAKP